MIYDELEEIKGFGCHLGSTITTEDFVKKEDELGIPIPSSLKDLYLMFHPNDPIFSIWLTLVPLHDLKITKIEGVINGFNNTIYVVTVFRDKIMSFGFAIRLYKSETKELLNEYTLVSDPPVYAYYTFPKTKSEQRYAALIESGFSKWIIGCIAFQQVYNQPSVVAIDQDKDIGKSQKNLWCQFNCINKADKIPVWVLKKESTILAINHDGIYPTPISSYGIAFGAKTDKPLEQLAQSTSLTFVWLKSQTNKKIRELEEFAIPDAREVYSIQPVLEFVCKLFGLDDGGTTENSMIRLEKRINTKLPIPFKEYYRYMPRDLYNAFNVLRPLSKLRQQKDGKIKFLEENQAVYHCAIDPQSPFLYRKWNRDGAEWEIFGILDGYLASEFVWNLACSNELNLQVNELSDFNSDMLAEGGKLQPYLSSIAGISHLIAVGNYTQLYETMGGKVIGLYNRLAQTFHFIAKEENDISEFFQKIGLLTDSDSSVYMDR